MSEASGLDPELAQVRLFLDDLDDLIRGLTDIVLLAAEDEANALLAANDEFELTVRSAVEGRLRELAGVVLQAEQRVTRRVRETATFVEDRLVGLSSIFVRGLEQDIVNLEKVAQNLLAKLQEPAEESATVLEQIVDAATDIVMDAVTDPLQVVEDVAKALQKTAIGQLTSLIEAFEVIAGPILTLATDLLPQLIADLNEKFGELVPALRPLFEGMTSAIAGQLIDWHGYSEAGDYDNVKVLLDPLIQEIEADPNLPEEIRLVLGPGFPGLGFLFPLLTGTILGAAIAPFIQAKFAAKVEKMRQASLEGDPVILLTPLDAIERFIRGGAGADQALNDLRLQGLNTARIGDLLVNRRFLPNLAELIQLWLRGELPGEEFEEKTAQLGILPTERRLFEILAFPIPNVSDLIRMAVREVFTPEIAERFGQFEEIPDAYLEWTARIGLTEFWARNFWAAHWALPSVNQGFEMLHRDVIDQEALDRLFVALDIMPFWREPLQKIAFRPISRVDIRRFHRVGTLTNDELIGRYRFLGFSPEDAALQADFTIRLNTDDDPDAAAELKALTRAQILDFLEEGRFPMSVAVDLLQGIGFSLFSATAFAEIRLLDVERKRLDLAVKIIRNRFENGSLTFNQASAAIDGLNLPVARRDFILTEIEAERQSKVSIPSKTQADALLEDGLITVDRYNDLLEQHGFSAEWRTVFTAQIEGQREGAPSTARPLSVSQLLAAFRSGDLDEAETKARLVAAHDFTEDDAQILLDVRRPPVVGFRPLTVAQLLKALGSGVLTRDVVRERLEREHQLSTADALILIIARLGT